MRTFEFEQLRDRHADCVAADLSLVPEAHAWLEQGARGGSVTAMRDYFRTALADIETPDAMLGNLDEVIRRRDLARAFARQAVEEGDVEILAFIGSSHARLSPHSSSDGDGILPADPMLAQTYWYVYALAQSSYYGFGEPFDQLWIAGPERRELAGLDEAQWQAVANAARSMYLRHFTDAPPR